MSDFSDAIAAAHATLSEVAGVTLTYYRGAQWVRLTGVPGTTSFTTDDGNGVIAEHRTRDYLISACDLKLGGTLVTPARGDLIKEQVGNQLLTYEVLSPDGGEQPWRYSDTGQSRIRVHSLLKSKGSI